MRLLLFFTAFLFYSPNVFSQKSDGSQDDLLFAKVLHKNIIGKKFVFGHWKPDGTPETCLVYLGKIKMQDGQVIKVMTLFRLWGLSKRGTSMLTIFTGNNNYVGCYYSICLSVTVKDGNLIFINHDYDCNAKTVVNLKDGLPEELFVKCQGKWGDLIPFAHEKYIPVKIIKFVPY